MAKSTRFKGLWRVLEVVGREAMLDEQFYGQHKDFVDRASAMVSLYGDEATEPSLRFAASLGKPCALIPCNECVHFFPQQNQTYDGYVEACLEVGKQHRGRFELVNLVGAPFSRALLVQPPLADWATKYADGSSTKSESLAVPLEVLKDLGVLHQVLWKMDLAQRA